MALRYQVICFIHFSRPHKRPSSQSVHGNSIGLPIIWAKLSQRRYICSQNQTASDHFITKFPKARHQLEDEGSFTVLSLQIKRSTPPAKNAFFSRRFLTPVTSYELGKILTPPLTFVQRLHRLNSDSTDRLLGALSPLSTPSLIPPTHPCESQF